jgi:hypothetical protein
MNDGTPFKSGERRWNPITGIEARVAARLISKPWYGGMVIKLHSKEFFSDVAHSKLWPLVIYLE